MDYLIAPTLFKNKTCRLPGIGTLDVITKSAETDYVNQQISAPKQSIVFSAAQDGENFFNEFSALGELIKKDLEKNRTVAIKGIGDFIKNDSGVINFIPLTLNNCFLPPVLAKQRMLDDKQNALLLIEQKLAKAEKPRLSVENKIFKNRWWVWAIVLGVIGLGFLGYHFYKHGFNALGNAIKLKL